MSTYKDCPNPECQGLVAPEAIHVSRWRKHFPPHRQYSVRARTTLVWCETCRRAFEIFETMPGLPRTKVYHQDEFPLQVAKIRRRIAIGNHQVQDIKAATERDGVDCFA